MKRKRLNAKFHIALGLVSLLVSLLLCAIFLGVMPDRASAVKAGRIALAESIAASSTVFIASDNVTQLQSLFGFVLERNPELQSLALRNAAEGLVVAIGDHQTQWHPKQDGHSDDAHVIVPLRANGERWGQLELRFTPLARSGWLGFFDDDRVRLVLLLAVASLVMFYVYLGRMLRHLDPSQAMPDRVRSALDTLAEGLLLIDVNGHIVLANQAFADLSGHRRDELVGKSIGDLNWTRADGAALDKQAYPWTEVLRSGLARRNDRIQLPDKEARRRSFIVNSSPILGANAKPGGALISLEDVTQLEEQEDELRKSKHAAETANRAKSDFLANMSHEIRTPMNAVLGFTQLLRRGKYRGTQELSKHLNTIHASGQHLLDLINDILDLSKVESGHMEIERVECAPYAVVSDVVQVLGVKAMEKGISLNLDCQGKIPETVRTDPARLRQIVTNLIGNAIKFTEQGGVKVTLRLLANSGAVHLAIDVGDSGIGIPADKLESVFDPFVQAESFTTRRYGGTGLGLTISRRFARALGGDITVQSELGKGSVFTLLIEPGPLDQVRLLAPDEFARSRSAEPLDSSAVWSFQPAKVLVVDDAEENRELVRILLEEVGLSVYEAVNGQEALDKASAKAFDLILMDMQMPVMDGFTATRRLRERGVKVPVIALTAHAMKGYEKEILEAGCSGYLTKPIDLDRLLRVLGERLKAEQKPRPSINSAPTMPIPEVGVKGSRGRQGDEFLEDDHTPIVSRLSTHPRLRAAVRTFGLRLNEKMSAMKHSCEHQDFDNLSVLAHWLKGAGGSVGFDVFTDPAHALEQHAKAHRSQACQRLIDQIDHLAHRIVIPPEAQESAAMSGTA